MIASKCRALGAALAAVALLLACAHAPQPPQTRERFSVAVIPDTQNYVDYLHQSAAGFPFDASELFIEQMRDVARRGVVNGGDLVFVASVGDVWQHQTEPIDPEHAARGIEAIDNPLLASELGVGASRRRRSRSPAPSRDTRSSRAAGIPFGVAPGNHDYDAMWSVAGFPPDLVKANSDPGLRCAWCPRTSGILHIGGLDNFRSAFGADSAFFRDQPWYVDHYAGGANSAQVFSGGGYEFLHIALQMQGARRRARLGARRTRQTPGQAHDRHHARLSGGGRRAARERDHRPRPHRPGAPQQRRGAVAEADLAQRPDLPRTVRSPPRPGATCRRQRFRPRCPPAARRLPGPRPGLGRGGARSPATSVAPVPIGDGWYRLLTFRLLWRGAARRGYDVLEPLPQRRRLSLATYSDWYREHEQPDASDAEFLASEHFVLEALRLRGALRAQADATDRALRVRPRRSRCGGPGRPSSSRSRFIGKLSTNISSGIATPLPRSWRMTASWTAPAPERREDEVVVEVRDGADRSRSRRARRARHA